MNGPFPAEAVDLSSVSLTRRIPVHELRARGWRTRAVDHATEILLNPATFPADRVRHDIIDVLLGIVLSFMIADVEPRLWKRDRRPLISAHCSERARFARTS